MTTNAFISKHCIIQIKYTQYYVYHVIKESVFKKKNEAEAGIEGFLLKTHHVQSLHWKPIANLSTSIVLRDSFKLAYYSYSLKTMHTENTCIQAIKALMKQWYVKTRQ